MELTPSLEINLSLGTISLSLPVATLKWVLQTRDIPISDKYSSELKILDGNLVLLNKSQTPIWSTNQNSTTSNSVVAVLGDDGNLILRDGSNSTQPIWQSFDYLVHTWLPSSKISYNKRANTHRSLTSWKNSEDPSPGLFSHILDANNSYVLLWNGSKQYWTSGPWNGEIFSLLPTTRQNHMLNISFVDNENESYLKYSP
ncbi:G-type lectin S-receptor-like serine/threonine-protein kinase [Camellia lanceoleosa]|nr:G-type lectin S-receptor-like serine/threonine-protein kinase [Camellia lanceoleosa]